MVTIIKCEVALGRVTFCFRVKPKIIMFLFAAFSRAAVDHYQLGNRLSEIGMKQQPNGGFSEQANQEANAETTYHAIYLGFTYGLYQHMNFPNAQRFITSLRNRDGGAGMAPGMKSSVEATYYYYKAASVLMPGAVDVPSIIEFLKNHYDSNSGLFRDSNDADPSVKATHFAYLTLHNNENELTWLNTFAIRNFITDHTQDDHYAFDGVDTIDAQIYGTSISKAISLSTNNYRAEQYVKKIIIDGIKAKNISLYTIGRVLCSGTSENYLEIPGEVKEFLHVTESINDLYYLTRLLAHDGQFEKMFDVQLYAITSDGQGIDLSRSGLTLNQVVRPAASVRLLKRFINQFVQVNVSITLGDEKTSETHLEFDERSGIWIGDRFTHATKLGPITFDVTAWMPIRDGNQVDMTKNIHGTISLPVDISCEATIGADELIPHGAILEPGAAIKSILHGRFEEGIEVEENTLATFAVYDSSDALLFYDSNEFKNDHTFNYVFDPKHPLPDGHIKVSVEIGDRQHGIHTRKEFRYAYKANMTVVSSNIKNTPKLGELLKVSLVPGVLNAEGVAELFKDEKDFGDDLHDAASESFYPSGVAEAQKYAMLLKCGNAVAKTVDGEVSVVDGSLSVEFETTVDENIDLATGFTIEFNYKNSEGFLVPLHMDQPIDVKLDTNIVAESVKGFDKPAKLTYGQAIKAELVVKEKNVGKTLLPGLAFPVIILKKEGRVIAERTASCDQKGLETLEFIIDASVPKGQVQAEIVVRKGDEYLPLLADGKALTQKFDIEGDIKFDAKVVQTADAITIDYTTLFNEKAITGGFFVAKLMTPDGQVAATYNAAAATSMSRISIPTKYLHGDYTVDLYRAGDNTAVVSTKVSVQSKVAAWFSALPIETLVVVAAFVVFCWSVHLRTQFRIRNI